MALARKLLVYAHAVVRTGRPFATVPVALAPSNVAEPRPA